MTFRLPAAAIALGFVLELSCLLAPVPAAVAVDIKAEEGHCESSPAPPPGEALLQVGTAPATLPSFAAPHVLPFVSSTVDPLGELHDEFDETITEVPQTLAAATAALAAASTSSPVLAATQAWAFDPQAWAFDNLHTVLYLCQDALILAAFVGGALFVRALRGKQEALREAAVAEEALRLRTFTVVEAAAEQRQRECTSHEAFRQHWEDMVAAARAPVA